MISQPSRSGPSASEILSGQHPKREFLQTECSSQPSYLGPSAGVTPSGQQPWLESSQDVITGHPWIEIG